MTTTPQNPDMPQDALQDGDMDTVTPETEPMPGQDADGTDGDGTDGDDADGTDGDGTDGTDGDASDPLQ